MSPTSRIKLKKDPLTCRCRPPILFLALCIILLKLSLAEANITAATSLLAVATAPNVISPAAITNSQATNHLQIPLEPINGTSNFRIYKKGKDDKHWLDGRGLSMQHVQCVRKGNCEKLQFSTCLGVKLPYTHTSLDLTISHSQKDIQERLKNMMALKHVPKCWAVIQPFICAVLAPKCENINGDDMVYLPSLEMCRLTLEPCRILYNTSYFPEYLKCNETHFPSKCNNEVREMKFNLTGQCLDPLVPAESSVSYHPGVEGCGVRCKDPLYTDGEHRQIQKLIGWGATLCFLCNLFVVATFMIDWENASKYPALIVFYINMCFMIACLGWLAQFTPGSREDIVCRKDGTLRHSEPTAGENLSCVVVFVIVYYFLIAAMVWFVFLTYAWHLRAVGNVQDRIDKKGSYFHLIAWSLPLVLTITTLALSEVDGNSIVGICFVGYRNHPIRSGLLLGPLCGVILVGGYFIIRGMIMLFGLKHFANDIKSTSASNKIHLIIVRMSVCALFTLLFILVSIACHVNEFRHSQEWAESLREYVNCTIFGRFNNEYVQCKLSQRPSVSVLQLHLLCLFGAGIVMSTWCWTPSSVETWKRYIRKKCGKDVSEEVKMPKHKVIAQTWAKRKEFEDKGRLSITLCNTHTDPVGLNFDVNDLNSSETNDISSTWANYLPQFVKRRMALTGATAANNASHHAGAAAHHNRKNSLDSEISFSVRHVSVESRRNSVDSQVSVKIQEMKTKVARSRGGRHHHHGKHSAGKRYQKARDFNAAGGGRRHNGRRESSTSIESQIIALQKTTYPNSHHKLGLFAQSTKNHGGSKRRSGHGTLDPNDITEFLARNGQLILPFLQNQGMTTSSDEEENSKGSLKIQGSRLDVVLKQDLSDDNSEEFETRHHNGPQIEEIHDHDNEEDDHTNMHGRSSKTKRQSAYEELLKQTQKSHDSNHNHKHSRNSTRNSRHSRKSQALNTSQHKRSLKRNQTANSNRRKSTNSKIFEMDSLNTSDLNLQLKRELTFGSHRDDEDDDEDTASNDSFSSVDLDLPLNVFLQHSLSGQSKTSCDVGIQADAFDLSNRTSADEDDLKKCVRHMNHHNQRRNRYEADAYEMQSLVDKHKNTPLIMSEAEKLKMLLLPSK
ncbi:protein smoothened isoform X1 [Musca domestica]|uniref:Protein smoothened n=1 Tax=Musca domestica TaxID=7370 RepID=A0A9J7I5W8_MUSDO|nr:protein smoothened isoform X1 [Musca domestica]